MTLNLQLTEQDRLERAQGTYHWLMHIARQRSGLSYCESLEAFDDTSRIC